MGQQDGSKAMTIYIVVCFALAMAALVGYKLMNDKRSVLADDYARASNQFADISLGYARNINNFHFGHKQGQYQRNDLATMMDTPQEFRRILEAAPIGMKEGARDGFTISTREEIKGRGENRYVEWKCTVVLDQVTQRQWMAFLSSAVRHSSQYASVETINVQRRDSNFSGMDQVRGADSSKWRVTFEFVWFNAVESGSATR